jgi:ribonuclease Y
MGLNQASFSKIMFKKLHKILNQMMAGQDQRMTQMANQKAQEQAREIVFQAKEEALKIKQEAERDARKTTSEALEMEKRVANKESQVEERSKEIDVQLKSIDNTKKQVESVKKELEEKRDKIVQKLQKVAEMSKDDARNLLLKSWEDKLKADVAKRIKAAEEKIKQNSEEKAKEILIDSMRYGATDYVAEYTLSVVNLPSEEWKGRIIGKDGRNIRAFELATGVDVDLEEEGVMKLSSFDAVRREIAKMSLERLLKDGRIQPQRIEEIVKKNISEMDKILIKAGEDLCHRVNVYNLPQELVKALGRFKYRYSYGQNMILHTLEETRIGIALANELKADVNTVKLGCLLHDIGKVIEDKEGSHVDLGVDLLKRYKFPQKVVDTVAQHHEDIPFTSVESVIVYIADAVSGGRPGARHEDLNDYMERIETIENAAKNREGVREVYALQAGRELRVIVRPKEVSDDEAVILSQKIKDELEEKFDIFPGQITVTVIREYRAEATTKI